MKNLLSLCMIVKNEENVLARCLDSVKGLVDEIIIVDTGSSDSTKEIASAYTTHVYDFEWCNDFSAARNEALRYATGKWILVLDADEYVQSTGHTQLRDLLKNKDMKTPQGFTINIMNFMGSGYDETMIMESSGARIFNRHPAISYSQPIHEQLISNDQAIHFSPISYTIFHSGYTKETVQQKNKSLRNLSILEAMKPDSDNEAYYYFTLGNEYSNAAERCEQALHAYQLSFDKSTATDTWYHHLMDRLITLEIQLGHHLSALKHIETGVQLKPNHTDYYCLKGILLDSLGYWTAAEDLFMKCIELSTVSKESVPFWIIQPSYGTTIPLQMLADISYKKGDINKSLSYWIKTLQVQPKNYKVLQRLIEHLLITESSEQIESILNMIYPKDKPINSVLLYKMSLISGSIELTRIYQSAVDKQGIHLGYSDRLLLHLLNKQPIEALKETEEHIPSHIALTAAIVYNNISFVNEPSVIESCLQLAKQAFNVLHDREWHPVVLEGNEQVFAQTLLTLRKYDYQDTYFTLLQQMANEKTINLLGSFYNQAGQINEALELYNLLLDNGLLDADGYKTVAQWYFNMGELEEGTLFLKASLESESSLDLLGRIQTYIPEVQRPTLLNKYYHYYSNLQTFPKF